jgi:hypothetical protein
VVVTELFNAGLHVPVIPLVDMPEREDKDAPAQIAGTGLNAGVMSGFTTIVRVAVVAHCPAAGVKVYVVVAVLLSAGLHVPVMPLIDVVGNAARTVPSQIACTGLNVGVTNGFTVIVSEVGTAHSLALGVNV